MFEIKFNNKINLITYQLLKLKIFHLIAYF